MSRSSAAHPLTGRHLALVVAALSAAYLQAVNISLPNAAVLHIEGALSMSDDEIGWVFSSYIAASAVVIPTTRWLVGRFGRKTVFQVSLALFATGLLLAAQATTTPEFIAARILQGAVSAPLVPLSIAILLEEIPSVHHARIGLGSTVTVLVGILSGPPIGGWLSEYHGWRSMFYLGVPPTLLVLLSMHVLLSEKRPAARPSFDFFGLATFSLGAIGLQFLLDRGERTEWFASPESWLEAAASALGFYLYIVHVLTSGGHFLDKALFRDRNFTLATVMFFAFGFVLLPTVALTSPMLEELLGYPPDTTGYLTIPRGIALVGALVLAAKAPAWIDNRLMVISGIALTAYGNWRMLGYSPLMDWRPVVTAGVLQGVGLGVLMPALNRAAFSTLDQRHIPEGITLFNLARLYGSTIGIAVVQLFFYENTQAMHLALGRNLTLHHAVGPAAGLFRGSHLGLLNELVTGQAAVVAVIGQFKLLMIVILATSPLALMLRNTRPLR